MFAQLGSVTDEHGTLIFAVFEMIVPGVSPRLTLTTSGKFAVALAASEAMLHEMVPVPPTGGMLAPQFHPAGTAKETKVAPVGMVSVNVAVPEAAGPLFVTDCV